ncbi:MAG: hypothetical protein ACRCW1_10075 [Anaerotignaceae bacterium]
MSFTYSIVKALVIYGIEYKMLEVEFNKQREERDKYFYSEGLRDSFIKGSMVRKND